VGWHASETDLALVRTGDLPRWKELLVERHLRRCATCSERADSYRELLAEMTELGHATLAEPPWLASRIVAAATHSRAPVPARALLAWARAAALLVLVLLMALLVGPRKPLPSRTSYQASVTAEAVVGETAGPYGRQRVVLYTGIRPGPVEVSASGGGIGVAYSDPTTGVVTITRIVVGE